MHNTKDSQQDAFEGQVSADAQVRREASFKDSLRQAQSMRLLDQVAGGMVIYPSFTEAASPRAAPAETSGRDVPPCRRQEFFEDAGRQMLQGGVHTFSSMATFTVFCHFSQKFVVSTNTQTPMVGQYLAVIFFKYPNLQSSVASYQLHPACHCSASVAEADGYSCPTADRWYAVVRFRCVDEC